MISKIVKYIYKFSASQYATIGAIVLVILWITFGPVFHFSADYQLLLNTITTIVTFIMVFVINNAQERDTLAINTKLDALILANQNIDNMLINLEDDSDENVFEIRSDIKNKATNQDEA